MEIAIKEPGVGERKMDKENINMQLVPFMMAIFWMGKKVDLVLLPS